ncbi:MAG: UDP-N-acetylmuramoyl-L-alanine--D-glutamate ligase [Gammaproteobacteria bacterium]|nr:UDP-N-acetylmuramoyl-L-alanine--D-glutamate ligase [Gammaproteobacteria bacterium]
MSAQTVHPQTETYTLVVGLGATGLSVARFLAKQGGRVVVADSRELPPNVEQLDSGFECHFGKFNRDLFRGAELIVLSPGVAADEPTVQSAINAGVEVIGDIELFARHAKSPVVGITGSNGKSTVTTLLGEMAREAGINVAVGGNIGTPALDLITSPEPELYILELSSFQLEVTNSLECAAAVVLNVSEDHLDRHHTLTHYAEIKAQVYHGQNGVMVINRDDPMVAEMAIPSRRTISYGLDKVEAANDYGVETIDNIHWLMRGEQRLISESALKVGGLHNLSNALAALALGEAVGLSEVAMLRALQKFTGLAHRCEWVAEIDGVTWFNDSKGTNVGATVAALNGLSQNRAVLIAGGQGKGADFSPLKEVVAKRARAVILIGEDGPLIEKAIIGSVQIIHAETLKQAVELAAENAQAGDAVLFSPACASFDMFRSYVDRGEQFVALVGELEG